MVDIYNLAASYIGVDRGGQGREFSVPSVNFSQPSKLSFYLKYYRNVYRGTYTQTCSVRIRSIGSGMKCDY